MSIEVLRKSMQYHLPGIQYTSDPESSWYCTCTREKQTTWRRDRGMNLARDKGVCIYQLNPPSPPITPLDILIFFLLISFGIHSRESTGAANPVPSPLGLSFVSVSLVALALRRFAPLPRSPLHAHTFTPRITPYEISFSYTHSLFTRSCIHQRRRCRRRCEQQSSFPLRHIRYGLFSRFIVSGSTISQHSTPAFHRIPTRHFRNTRHTVHRQHQSTKSLRPQFVSPIE